MFLSSGQVGYSKKQKRSDSVDAILFVPAITVTADRPPLTFPRHEHMMFKTFLQNRSCAAQVYSIVQK